MARRYIQAFAPCLGTREGKEQMAVMAGGILRVSGLCGMQARQRHGRGGWTARLPVGSWTRPTGCPAQRFSQNLTEAATLRHTCG